MSAPVMVAWVNADHTADAMSARGLTLMLLAQNDRRPLSVPRHSVSLAPACILRIRKGIALRAYAFAFFAQCMGSLRRRVA